MQIRGHLLYVKFTIGILLLATRNCYAQYRIKQIDSIYSQASSSVDFNSSSKSAIVIYNASKAMNYDKGVVEGLILFAQKSSSAGQNDNAFKYIVQAENASVNIKDPVLLSKILTIKGICYLRLGFYKEAEQTLNSAASMAKTIENKEDMHYYLTAIYTDLAMDNERSGNLKERDFWGGNCYNESLQLEKSKKYLWVSAIAASNRGSRFTKLKQYDSAGFYVNKALLLADKYSDQDKYRKNYTLWVADLHAGDFYYAQKKFPGSEVYYKKAVSAATQIKYAYCLKGAYAGLAKVYTALNKPKEALKCFERSNQLADSLALVDKAAIKVPLDYIVHDNEEKLSDSEKRYRRILLITGLALLIITCAVLFYRRRFKKEIMLNKEKINELIKKIKVSDDRRSPLKMEELKQIVELAVNNNPAFLMKFNEYDTEFSKKLLAIAPTLIAAEIEFCAMLRLNFETKEIARYTRISVRAVEGKKSRIRKKLNIPSDYDINLWMTQI